MTTEIVEQDKNALALENFDVDAAVIDGYVMPHELALVILKSFNDNNIDFLAKIRKDLKISTPGSGGLAFKVPTGDPEERPKIMETVKMVVVWATEDYALYEGDYGKDGAKAPVCKSTTGKAADLPFPQNRYGLGSPENPTGGCQVCPMGKAVWLGEKKQGKIPCRWGKQVFAILPGVPTPYMISVAPTGAGNFETWISNLALKAQSTTAVEVEMSIETDKQNNGGADYSKMAFKSVRKLTPEEKISIRGLSEAYVPLIVSKVRTPVAVREPDELAAIKQQLLTTGGRPVAPQGVGETKEVEEDEPVL